MDNSLEAPKGFSALWTLYAISFFLGLGNVIQIYRWLLKISSRTALTIFIAVCNEEEGKREKMKKIEKRSVLQRFNKKHLMVGVKIPLGSLVVYTFSSERSWKFSTEYSGKVSRSRGHRYSHLRKLKRLSLSKDIVTVTFIVVFYAVEQKTYSTTPIRPHVPFYIAIVVAVGYFALALGICIIKSRAQGQRIVFETPPNWQPMFTNKETFRLKEKSEEYKEVEDRFRRTIESEKYEITCIHRIQNKELFGQFIVARENMKSLQKKERRLWHGTSGDVVENINKGGFNRSYCGKNATVYGKGVYFAKKSKYSSQDTYTPKDNDGNKLMYLCRVLTGDYVQGKTSMVEPPEREKGVRYHSVVDDARNPTIFVIFKDAQAYPDYLVKFHEKVDDV